MNEFIATLFLTRELAHRYHLNTKSYSQHKALGHFYEELEDQIDALTEMWQGKVGIIDIPIMSEKVKKEVNTLILSDLRFKNKREKFNTIWDKLKSNQEYLGEFNAYKVASKDDTPIQNHIDTIVENFLSTIYKLENLK